MMNHVVLKGRQFLRLVVYFFTMCSVVLLKVKDGTQDTVKTMMIPQSKILYVDPDDYDTIIDIMLRFNEWLSSQTPIANTSGVTSKLHQNIMDITHILNDMDDYMNAAFQDVLVKHGWDKDKRVILNSEILLDVLQQDMLDFVHRIRPVNISQF